VTADPDRVLRSAFLDGKPSWLDRDEPVEHGHVLAGALRTRLTPTEVVSRLSALGFRVAAGRLPARVASEDDILVSVELTGWPEWLPVGEPVPVAHVLRAAVVTGRTPAAVADRLAALGYRVPDAPPASAVEPDDIRLMSSFLDGEPSWLEPEETVPAGHVLAAAAKLSRSPSGVAERLGVLGYEVEDVSRAAAEVLPGDQVLVSVELTGWPEWLPTGEAVPVSHVLRAAAVTGQTPQEVALRLAALGYLVPDAPPATAVESGDRVLLSSGLDGSGPWLNPHDRVPHQHVRDAARALKRDPSEITARLELFGHRM
jgi:hypothetical protein